MPIILYFFSSWSAFLAVKKKSRDINLPSWVCFSLSLQTNLVLSPVNSLLASFALLGFVFCKFSSGLVNLHWVCSSKFITNLIYLPWVRLQWFFFFFATAVLLQLSDIFLSLGFTLTAFTYNEIFLHRLTFTGFAYKKFTHLVPLHLPRPTLWVGGGLTHPHSQRGGKGTMAGNP